MGLAGSQARFLSLTARKSNIEYQGQQINQQRTVLANKSSDVVNQMLALQPPTPPTSSSEDYYRVTQTFSNLSDGTVNGNAGNPNVKGQTEKITGWTLVDAVTKTAPTATTTSFCYEVSYSYQQDGETVTGAKMYTQAKAFTAGTDLRDVSNQMSTAGIFDVDDKTGNIIEKMIIDNAASFGTGATGLSSYDASSLLFGTSFNDQKYNDAMNKYDFDKYTYDKAITDINAQTEKIQAQDKSLELKLKQLDSEHTAVQTELEAIKSVIDKNIGETFKTFAGS